MSEIYYAIAWYFGISYHEAIEECEEMSNEMVDAIYYRYKTYMHHGDILNDEEDDEEDPEQFVQIAEYKEEYEDG